MSGLKFPIGEQDFSWIRQQGFIYIDKTSLIYDLINEGTGYFLSRPRRMGKSLLLSLFKALFSGERHLFEGLAIAKTDYVFTRYPIVALDFSRLTTTSAEALIATLNNQLQRIADQHHLGLIHREQPNSMLEELVYRLSEGQKRVVILIDEYDKPLVDHLSDLPLALSYREILNNFFAMTKSLYEHIRFLFVTGVSKFAKTSLFSGMNHLNDLSLQHRYAALLGITEQEIDENLSFAVEKIAEQRGETAAETRRLMRTWYNGYRFARLPTSEKVYNPLSLISFLKEGELTNYWFSTGTPTFALDMIQKTQYPIIDFEMGIKAGSEIETSHDLQRLDLIVLLYQTGYLTIADYSETSQIYVLHFPNEEVRHSFFTHLLHLFLAIEPAQARPYLERIRQALNEANFAFFVEVCNSLLARIPYPIHIAKEAYYHSLLYVMLYSIGFEVEAEVMTNRGRLDLKLILGNKLYILEFKLDASAEIALEQIRQQQYYLGYAEKGLEIFLVGINFNSEERKIDEWLLSQPSVPKKGYNSNDDAP